jgi:taurine dioxygenase
MRTTTAGFTVRAVTASIGAEISGVDLSRPLDDDTWQGIADAFHRHLVLFFRGQPLSPDEQVAFARRFGRVEPHPFAKPHPSHPELTVLDQTTPETDGTNSWHSDSTFMEEPPLGSVLQAVQLPPVGGDTCWASMYAAYDALSEPIRSLLDHVTAVHDITEPLEWSIRGGHTTTADVEAMRRAWPPVEHPAVRTHPVTGRRALFVNRNFTTRLCGLTDRENTMLLSHLFQHVERPDFQVRFRWEPNSVAIWDNRCTQHYAVPDYTGHRRIMHRVMIQGDRPQ